LHSFTKPENKQDKEASAVHLKAITIGFWAALLTAVFTILFVISTFVFLPPNWNGIESYSKSFYSLQMISVVPPMKFAVTSIVLMVSFHCYVVDRKKIYSLLSIAFSIIYATII
jgi:hypothetical protein